MLLSIPFLHSDHIKAKSIFPCNFMTLRKVIDLLVFIEAFIEITLATAWAPKDVPFMTLSRGKWIIFKHRSNKFVIKPKHFVKELAIFNMITLLISVELHAISYHLLLCDALENKKIWFVLIVMVRIICTGLAIEESSSTLSTRHTWTHSSIWNSCWALYRVVSSRHDALAFVFQILELSHYFAKLSLSLFFLNWTFTDSE